MANKSDKPVNGQAPKTLQEIEQERERRLAEINKKRSSGHKEISDTVADLREDYKYASNATERLDITEQIGASLNLRNNVNSRASQDINGQNKIMADRIATYTKERNVTERTTKLSGSTRFFKEAQNSDLLSVPTEVLEQRINAGVHDINGLGSTLSNTVRNSSRPLGQEFQSIASQVGQKEEEVALLKRVKNQQNRAGLSTEKIFNTFENTVNSGKAGLDVLGDRNIANAAKEGHFGSLEQETEKLKNVLGNLEKTFSDYQEASEKFASDQSDTNKKLLDASLKKLQEEEKAVDKQKKIVRAVDQHGGNGDRSFGERFSEGVGFAKRTINAFNGMNVTDEITQVKLKAAAGATGVEQFNNINAAVGGDMKSLLMEMNSDSAKDFSDTMRNKQIFYSTLGNVANVAGVATSGAGAGIDGAIKGFKAGGPKGALISGIAGAGGELIAGGAEAARSINQQALGIPQTQVAIDAYQSKRQLTSVEVDIKAQVLQKLQNQSMAAHRGTIGAGSNADAAYSTLLDSTYLGNMADQGMTPGQAAQLTSLSISSVGSAAAGTGMALKAAKAQATGMMSAEQFVGMSGQLANSGGGSGKELEEIMKNAVAAGMDNAKNIQQMVSATASLSSNMAKMGIGGVGGASSIIGAMAQGIGGDKNLAMTAAQSQAELRSSLDSSVGMDIGAVYEFEALREAFPTASTMQLRRMATLTQEELQTMSDNPEVAKEYGIYSQIKDNPVNATTRLGEIGTKATKISFGSGWSYAEGSEDERASFSMGGLSTAGEKNNVNVKVKKGEIVQRDNAGFSFEKNAAKREAQQVNSAGQGDPIAVLNSINEALQKLANITPQQSQEKVESSIKDMKAAGPALSAAGDSLEKGADAFSASVDKFNRVLDRMAPLNSGAVYNTGTTAKQQKKR